MLLLPRTQLRGNALALAVVLATGAAPPLHRHHSRSSLAAPDTVEFLGTTACPELPKQGAGVSGDRVKFVGTAANISACAEAAAAWVNASAPRLWQR
jgi:hypothetical protein